MGMSGYQTETEAKKRAVKPTSERETGKGKAEKVTMKELVKQKEKKK